MSQFNCKQDLFLLPSICCGANYIAINFILSTRENPWILTYFNSKNKFKILTSL